MGRGDRRQFHVQGLRGAPEQECGPQLTSSVTGQWQHLVTGPSWDPEWGQPRHSVGCAYLLCGGTQVQTPGDTKRI